MTDQSHGSGPQYPPGRERSPCTATIKSGAQCRAFAPEGRVFCMTHDPERQGAIQEARAKGGAKASKLRALQGRRSRLSTARELIVFTASTIHDTLDGRLPVDVARCVFYGISIQRALIESGDLEKRLAALEQTVNEGRQPRRAW